MLGGKSSINQKSIAKNWNVILSKQYNEFEMYNLEFLVSTKHIIWILMSVIEILDLKLNDWIQVGKRVMIHVIFYICLISW